MRGGRVSPRWCAMADFKQLNIVPSRDPNPEETAQLCKLAQIELETKRLMVQKRVTQAMIGVTALFAVFTIGIIVVLAVSLQQLRSGIDQIAENVGPGAYCALQTRAHAHTRSPRTRAHALTTLRPTRVVDVVASAIESIQLSLSNTGVATGNMALLSSDIGEVGHKMVVAANTSVALLARSNELMTSIQQHPSFTLSLGATA